MKKSITYLLAGLSILHLTTPALAKDETMTHQLASYIPMTAAHQKADAFAQFLTGAAPLVKETEPGTELWFALQGAPEDQLAIFDIFADETGREAHFAGQVAGLLKEQSSTLVAGGWEEGVVANVRNYKILAIK